MTILSDPTIQETMGNATRLIRESESHEAGLNIMEAMMELAFLKGRTVEAILMSAAECDLAEEGETIEDLITDIRDRAKELENG